MSEVEPSAEPDLARKLREAAGDELVELLEQHLETIDPRQAVAALRNPHADREAVAILLRSRRLLGFYDVRREIASHPHTPRPHALQLVPGLFWRDLLALGLDIRVTPVVRRAAERRMIDRVPALTVGEKVAIARRGSPGILAQLRRDPSERVIKALLENPRLTEGTLIPLVNNDQAVPAVLQTIARDRRWGVRYEVRLGLARNPRTPTTTALGILPHLRKSDLKTVASDNRLGAAVRRRARLLLGEG